MSERKVFILPDLSVPRYSGKNKARATEPVISERAERLLRLLGKTREQAIAEVKKAWRNL